MRFYKLCFIKYNKNVSHPNLPVPSHGESATARRRAPDSKAALYGRGDCQCAGLGPGVGPSSSQIATSCADTVSASDSSLRLLCDSKPISSGF